VRGFVAPTDHGWYQFLRARPEIDEVNFWRDLLLQAQSTVQRDRRLRARHAVRATAGVAPWDIFGHANGTATSMICSIASADSRRRARPCRWTV
jgi:hypothetical protein